LTLINPSARLAALPLSAPMGELQTRQHTATIAAQRWKMRGPGSREETLKQGIRTGEPTLTEARSLVNTRPAGTGLSF
jgi:hypothetical protein